MASQAKTVNCLLYLLLSVSYCSPALGSEGFEGQVWFFFFFFFSAWFQQSLLPSVGVSDYDIVAAASKLEFRGKANLSCNELPVLAALRLFHGIEHISVYYWTV